MAKEKTGLVLVTGATGSGKTTTLAALLNEINEEQPVHIVTLEDPIEFVHPTKRATFNQRELGHDFNNSPNGLRAALRQAPKVILVGEMRDRATVEVASMPANRLTVSLDYFRSAKNSSCGFAWRIPCATSSASGSRRKLAVAGSC